MSGQTAIRGFTYQAIASVIQSLSRSDWDYVKVEPNTALDKVDIFWESEIGELSCQQVKSSINNFSKADIVTWIESMISDVPNAGRYQLFLIGNVATPVNDFIKTINNANRTTPISPVIDANGDKIQVDLIVFKLDYLESKVRDEVSRFLSSANYYLPHSTISIISGGLIYQFFQFSVLGSKVSRAEFSEHLLEWVRFNYTRDLGEETRRSKFSIQFYDVPGRNFVTSMRPYNFHLEDRLLTKEFRSKVVDLCRLISSIDLPERIKPQMEIGDYYSPIRIPLLSDLSDADVSEERRAYIKERLKKWFNINVEGKFFNVGNLKQNLMTLAMPMMGRGYSGSENEKKKGDAITDLYWELHSIQAIKDLVDFLNACDYYILILENNGSSHDEDLSINLTIPSTVKIVTPDTFLVPNDLDALETLINFRFVSSVLGIKADSLIKEYEFENFIDIDAMGDLDMVYRMTGESRRLELKKERFLHRVQSLMDLEVYSDMPGYIQLRYLFKRLNPGIRMAFPSVLLFKGTSDFKIGYEITSKHSAVVHRGELRCLVGPSQ